MRFPGILRLVWARGNGWHRAIALACAASAALSVAASARAVDADVDHALAQPAADPASDSASGIAYADIYRGYLGMRQDEIDLIPWYRSTYGISDDECLSIAVIAHAAYRPFAGAVQDFNGPCHHRIDELMRWYTVPSEVLFVDVPAYTTCPPSYRRLYEPYWDGSYRDAVYSNANYSNADCWSLISLRISTEYRACPPRLFFDRVNACGSSQIAFQQQGEWWPDGRRQHDHVFAPATLRQPATVVAGTDSGLPSSTRAPAVAVERVPTTNQPPHQPDRATVVPRAGTERAQRTATSPSQPADSRPSPVKSGPRPAASGRASGSQSGSRTSAEPASAVAPVSESSPGGHATTPAPPTTEVPREFQHPPAASSASSSSPFPPSPSPPTALTSAPPRERAQTSTTPIHHPVPLEMETRSPHHQPQQFQQDPSRPAERTIAPAPRTTVTSSPPIRPAAPTIVAPLAMPSATSSAPHVDRPVALPSRSPANAETPPSMELHRRPAGSQ